MGVCAHIHARMHAHATYRHTEMEMENTTHQQILKILFDHSWRQGNPRYFVRWARTFPFGLKLFWLQFHLLQPRGFSTAEYGVLQCRSFNGQLVKLKKGERWKDPSVPGWGIRNLCDAGHQKHRIKGLRVPAFQRWSFRGLDGHTSALGLLAVFINIPKKETCSCWNRPLQKQEGTNYSLAKRCSFLTLASKPKWSRVRYIELCQDEKRKFSALSRITAKAGRLKKNKKKQKTSSWKDRLQGLHQTPAVPSLSEKGKN